MTTIVRRRDNGHTDNPTQFGEHHRQADDVDLALANAPIDGLRAYSDVVTFTPAEVGALGDALTWVDVYPSPETPGQILVKGVRELNFNEVFGGYAHPNRAWQMERFFAETYGADLDFDDELEDGDSMFDLVQVQMYTLVPEGSSRQQAFDAVLVNTKATELVDDKAELLPKLRAFVDANVFVKDRGALRDSEAVTLEWLDTAIALRSGERELSDAQAISIANRMDAETYPEWHKFGQTGIADRKAFHDELYQAYQAEWGRKKDWANMMFTYLLNGGDND